MQQNTDLNDCRLYPEPTALPFYDADALVRLNTRLTAARIDEAKLAELNRVLEHQNDIVAGPEEGDRYPFPGDRILADGHDMSTDTGFGMYLSKWDDGKKFPEGRFNFAAANYTAIVGELSTPVASSGVIVSSLHEDLELAGFGFRKIAIVQGHELIFFYVPCQVWTLHPHKPQ